MFLTILYNESKPQSTIKRKRIPEKYFAVPKKKERIKTKIRSNKFLRKKFGKFSKIY